MEITGDLIEKVHRLANKKLLKDYPLFDMANLLEGHITRYEIRYVLEALNEVMK